MKKNLFDLETRFWNSETHFSSSNQNRAQVSLFLKAKKADPIEAKYLERC